MTKNNKTTWIMDCDNDCWMYDNWYGNWVYDNDDYYWKTSLTKISKTKKSTLDYDNWIYNDNYDYWTYNDWYGNWYFDNNIWNWNTWQNDYAKLKLGGNYIDDWIWDDIMNCWSYENLYGNWIYNDNNCYWNTWTNTNKKIPLPPPKQKLPLPPKQKLPLPPPKPTPKKSKQLPSPPPIPSMPINIPKKISNKLNCGYNSDCSDCSDGSDGGYSQGNYYNNNKKLNIPQNHEKYIIIFSDNIDLEMKVNNLDKKSGFKSKHMFKSLCACSVTMNKNMINDLLDDIDIKYIEKDTFMSFNLHSKTKLPLKLVGQLWHQSITNTLPIVTDNFSSIHCYILDTGILSTHVEFIPGQVILDYNAITNTIGNSQDDNGHGTAVASMVGGITVGTAIKTTLHSIKVLDSTGSGYVSDIIAGISWVINNKKTDPCIINLSLGGSYSATFNTIIQKCITYNITIVCASGNSSMDASNLTPASSIGAFAISAYDQTKTEAVWSNFGPSIGSFAPGVSIQGAWGDAPNSFYLISGTSFSCPIVVGIIIRYLKIVPNATQIQIITFLNKANLNNEIINIGVNTPNKRLVWNINSVIKC